jgi:hypothetical protein
VVLSEHHTNEQSTDALCEVTMSDTTTSEDPIVPSNVRGKVTYIQGKYLKRRKRLPDFTKYGKQLLLERINDLNQTRFTFNDLEFGSPEIQYNQPYNTRVRIFAKAASGLTRYVDVQYNRFRLLNALPSKELVDYSPTVTDTTTVHDLLVDINYRYGVALTEDDVYDDPVPTDGSWITLRVKETSYLYEPEDSDLIPVNLRITTTDLSGFSAPVFSLIPAITVTDLTGFNEPVEPLSSLITVTDLSGFSDEAPEPVSLFGMLKSDL